jgi:hypothetical protein
VVLQAEVRLVQAVAVVAQVRDLDHVRRHGDVREREVHAEAARKRDARRQVRVHLGAARPRQVHLPLARRRVRVVARRLLRACAAAHLQL